MSTVTDPRRTMRELTDVLRAGAADVDVRRAISPEVSQTLKDAGVFGLLAPRSIGGAEVDPLTCFDVVEQAAREIYGDPQIVTAGAFRPNGVAVKVDGGYRVSGRWPQGSGACHADWFLGGAVVVRDGEPVIGPTPVMRELWFPATETEIIDTWTSTGLRGPASHDYAVSDVFVPAERSCWFMEPPSEPGPLYQMAPIAMFTTFISAVPLGIARHALDDFVALSQRKVPVLSQNVLADKPVANTKVGRAQAIVESGHAYVRGRLAEQWAAVCDDHRPTMAERGALWLASTHAAQTALEAVELLYGAAGADAVYAASALDRCLRDARTAVQHICSQEVNYEVASRLASGRMEGTMASHWIIDYRGEGVS